MVKILRKSYENHVAQFPKFSVSTVQKSIFRRFCIYNVKDGIQIQIYNINNESGSHFSQFISVKVKKNLIKSQNQFREKLRKLRLRQNNSFVIKKTCMLIFLEDTLHSNCWHDLLMIGENMVGKMIHRAT